jgi:predicted phage terminase large subunit-like protein
VLLALVVALSMSLADDVRELETVTWELERRGLVAPDFGAWLGRHRREFRWDYAHMRVMQREFDALSAGEHLRLLLQISGRHGKTEHVLSYGAYVLNRDPTTRVLFVTHSDDHARDMSDRIQRVALSAGVTLSDTRASLSHWKTSVGGGLQVVGLGASTASFNADLILIDDPIGKRAQAESQAERDRVWLSLTTDILARSEPTTRVVFSMPRWHTDDASGRLQTQQPGRWRVVDMPGRSLGESDALGRPDGAVLWPEMRDETFHDGARIELGEYGYASFIQCRPSPRGGGMFKWDWWREIDAVPATGQMVRYWDVAGTDVTGANDPDYTAGVLACRMPDQRTALVDVERFRLSVAARDAKILEVAKSDRATYRGRVTWWFETETGIAGAERTANVVRAVQNVGIACHSERPTGSKVIRAEPFASKAEAGNVVLCPGEWRDAFRLECAQFPTGGHDDQVDAAVGADSKVGISRTVGVQRVRL